MLGQLGMGLNNLVSGFLIRLEIMSFGLGLGLVAES